MNEALKLHGCFASLFSADTDRVVDRADEYLSVADLSRFGCFDDRFDSGVDPGISHHNFQLNLGKEIHRVFAAPVNLRVALLPAKALYLADRHALDSQAGKSLFDAFEFERLDDGIDLFHVGPSTKCRGGILTTDVSL